MMMTTTTLFLPFLLLLGTATTTVQAFAVVVVEPPPAAAAARWRGRRGVPSLAVGKGRNAVAANAASSSDGPEPATASSAGKSFDDNDDDFETSPLMLEPFAPAEDPRYSCEGPVGEGDFLVSRAGEPTLEELSDDNVLKIVKVECTDLEVNTLVWKCLGYRFEGQDREGGGGDWVASKVFPKWKERYPAPPDFIGMKRIYSKEVDQPSLRSNQALVRSVPVEHKQNLKKFMKPLGWSGYKYAELTPNKTRRAQCANWLLYYREALFGKTLEQLQEEKLRKQQQEEKESKEGGEWKPPVKEVF